MKPHDVVLTPFLELLAEANIFQTCPLSFDCSTEEAWVLLFRVAEHSPLPPTSIELVDGSALLT